MVLSYGMERSLHERDRVGVQDSVLLENYNSEEAFIENLKKRFSEDLIYTYIGQVLLSVNPYRSLPIYTSQDVQAYQRIHLFEAPPHIYALTDNAYRSLIEERREQCILISGESGSGKTEASKKVLQFIAEVSQHKGQVERVKDKLLQSNPVLEAFGNAKTNRNDNSSRFGKYMDIAFNFLGEPVGGNILNYLLEKSRVVHQSAGERNFHVFYQLLAGADDAMLSELCLQRDLSKYTYLTDTEASTPELNDEHHYQEVRKAMDVIELTSEEQREIYQIVASILHLGNAGFTEEEGVAELNNTSVVQTVSQLLGCRSSDLAEALTHRTIDARGDVVTSPLSREMAVYARDALAKAIYDRLFSWLIQRLNTSLQPEESDAATAVMGILDIYGFEIFQMNSFEQFCINYCNEKLQQLFIELTLKSEQEEYLKEGIEWEPVTYFNNKIICDLIEEKHKGIISILDEECLRPGDPTDLSFLEKMTDKLIYHKHFISHQKADKKVQKIMGREEFKLVHYAGEVTYSINGFLEKNNDLLFRDLRLVMSKTSNSITKSIFPHSEVSSKRRPETAITQFKNSLTQLMVILSSKEPSYIRCIKPNDFKAPGVFDEHIVSHQVKYLGLMENLRVRRAGFAYRRRYEEFLKRYKSLSAATWPHYRGNARDGVQELATALGYQHSDYRMGNTKIFIRYAKTLFETEDAFQERKHSLVASIQARWKGFIQRREFLRQRQAAIVAQSWIRRFLAQRELERRRHAAMLVRKAVIMQTWVRRLLAQNEAERRRKAVQVVRNFIKGFITRNQGENELNHRFIQISRKQYLLRLAKSLPQSVLVQTWPSCPLNCREVSQELRKLHKAWLSRKYRLSLSPEMKEQLQLKVLAESLFKGKKKSYPASVGERFVRNRLSEAQSMMKSSFQNTLPAGDNLQYSSTVHKFDRHGYKKRDRVLFLTNTSLCLAVDEGKTCKLKHKLPLNALVKLEVTSESDRFILLRLSPEHQKTDKGDLILEMPNVIEFVTMVTSVTNDRDLLNINNIENGQQLTHVLSDGKEGKIDLTMGQNGPGITKGKSGHLIVVG